MATTGAVNDFSKYTAVAAKTDSTAATATKKTVNGALNQAQFLQLMTTQMTHQDPSKPMQNGDFLVQMAQFGTVSGIQDLQKSFSDFASSMGSGQSLQAANLVGHAVSVTATQGVLGAGQPIKGEINLTETTTNLTLQVKDSNGAVVDTVNLGPQAKGSVPFSWDGVKGQLADPGTYNITATALTGDTSTAMDTQIQSQVESVTMGNGSSGISVKLTSGESVNFNQVKQIF